MFLGQIERDRQRLPQDESLILDRRQAPVRIDGEIVRLARALLADLERHVLVVEPELLGDPQRAKRARPGDAVDAQPGHPVSRA